MKDFILDLDKSRELRFGFKAMRTIRQKFGDKSMDALLNIKVDEVPAIAWAGLKWEDKQLTVDQVEVLLDDAIPKKYTILEITEIVLEALAVQMGVESKKVKAGTPGTVVEKTEAEKTEEVKTPEAAKVETEKKKQPTETIPSTRKQKK